MIYLVKMSRILVLFFVVCASFAQVPKFSAEQLFKLAKDQKAFIHIRLKGAEQRETFEFSWTLYDGLNLVVHSKWRKYPRQITLSRRRGLELYKQNALLPMRNPYKDDVSVYLEFVSFENSKAKIRALIYDQADRVDVEFWPPMNAEEGKDE